MRALLSKKLGSLFVLTIILAATVWAALNAQLIVDNIAYYQYQPSDEIASFVSQTGMNDHGEFMFYASQPSLEKAESFNQQCGEEDKTAAILGCYNGQKIYIYDITDPRLSGIRPTTAAHEMLHAAYQRLKSDDKQSVDNLLDAEYAKLKDDPDLKSRMAFYAKTQPNDRLNELHSIIGTEIADINPKLESYYNRYFFDRSKVVAQHKKYNLVFEELRDHATKLTKQINQLKASFQEKRQQYQSKSQVLQGDITRFNQRSRQGGFDSQSEFDDERQKLVYRSNQLESLRLEINDQVKQYNDLVSQLNAIAVETESLNHSLDSSLEPVPKL